MLHVGPWSNLVNRQDDCGNVGLFLELGRRLCAHIGAVHMFPRAVLHQWLYNESTERLRQHTSWMEAFVFPLTTNQPAKVRCVCSRRHSRYCPRRYNPATESTGTFHGTAPHSLEERPTSTSKSRDILSVHCVLTTDHSATFFVFVLFFRVFRFKVIFWGASDCFSSFCVSCFCSFFSPVSLLQDRGAGGQDSRQLNQFKSS